MEFQNFAEAQSVLLWSAFAIAVVMGAVVNKTNFCTMGAVSDWVNMGDTGRLRAWLFAMAVAMIGVAILEAAGVLRISDAFPPYRGGQLVWLENLLGGLMFGIGMTLASGCGNKCLIRIGGGNIKSIMVLAIIGVIAYYMVNPLPGTDETLMSLLFYRWMRPTAIDMGASQDLGFLFGGAESAAIARTIIGVAIALLVFVFVFKSAEFRKSFDNILGGLVVGGAVLAAWYVSSTVSVNLDGEVYNLAKFAQDWDFLAESSEGKPAEIRSLNPQSYTFINPMGQTVGYAATGFQSKFLTFGIMSVFGVILGSFLWAVISKGFRIEKFASFADFRNHLVGAVLMGFGGVLGMGCTIGQAVTGASTLAIGSFITFGAIVLGCALTMKVQYYKLVYEEEATFMKSLITAFVDFKMLPASMRKLDAV
ncbi:MAG: YeeE/YedE family protein [Gammaproteobacteria bacterium]|nr:YeeE/YedE family protein [Gammaproteobacteria bacterium]